MAYSLPPAITSCSGRLRADLVSSEPRPTLLPSATRRLSVSLWVSSPVPLSAARAAGATVLGVGARGKMVRADAGVVRTVSERHRAEQRVMAAMIDLRSIEGSVPQLEGEPVDENGATVEPHPAVPVQVFRSRPQPAARHRVDRHLAKQPLRRRRLALVLPVHTPRASHAGVVHLAHPLAVSGLRASANPADPMRVCHARTLAATPSSGGI